LTFGIVPLPLVGVTQDVIWALVFCAAVLALSVGLCFYPLAAVEGMLEGSEGDRSRVA
jgi:hypothetical protein